MPGSAIKIKKLLINGVEYALTTFDAEFGFELLLTLTKQLSDPIAGVISGAGAGGSEEENNKNFLGSILGSLKTLQPRELTELIKLLITKNTRLVEKKRHVKMSDFTGDYIAMLQLAKEIIEFNYANFFSNIKTIFQKA